MQRAEDMTVVKEIKKRLKIATLKHALLGQTGLSGLNALELVEEEVGQR